MVCSWALLSHEVMLVTFTWLKQDKRSPGHWACRTHSTKTWHKGHILIIEFIFKSIINTFNMLSGRFFCFICCICLLLGQQVLLVHSWISWDISQTWPVGTYLSITKFSLCPLPLTVFPSKRWPTINHTYSRKNLKSHNMHMAKKDRWKNHTLTIHVFSTGTYL